MTQLKVATYNIRMDAYEDAPWTWAARRPHVFEIIRYFDWDLFGVQEVLPHQLTDFETLNEYAFVGTTREDGKNNGEYNGIFYKKNALSELTKKSFGFHKRQMSLVFTQKPVAIVFAYVAYLKKKKVEKALSLPTRT